MNIRPESAIQSRHIDIDGLCNLRDLGGLPVGLDRQIRPGQLFRSDAPIELCATAVESINDLHLRTVVDLRSSSEAMRAKSSLVGSIAVISADISEQVDDIPGPVLGHLLSGKRAQFTEEDLTALYQKMLRDYPKRFGLAISALAAPEALPALVHCAAGKDRTGLVIAMVLDVVGVDRDAILCDYELTTERRAHRRGLFRADFEKANIAFELAEGIFVAPRASLSAALNYLEQTHGSVRGYLTGPAGVLSSDLDALGENLTQLNPRAELDVCLFR